MVIKGAQMSGISSSHSHKIKTSETEEENCERNAQDDKGSLYSLLYLKNLNIFPLANQYSIPVLVALYRLFPRLSNYKIYIL